MFLKVQAFAPKFTSILTAALLTACGGGGDGSGGDDSSSSGNQDASTTALELKPGGYYTQVNYEDDSSVDAITFLSPTGKFVNAVSRSDITLGELTFSSGDTVTGSGTNVFYSGDWQAVEGSLNGRVQSDESAVLTATAPDYTSQITLRRENSYSDIGVTLSQVEGTYTMDGPNTYTTSVTISADGAVTGSDVTGCVINGKVSIPATQYNVFEVNYTASNCGDIPEASGSFRNGEFSGLGAYDPELGELEFGGTDGDVAAFFIGTK